MAQYGERYGISGDQISNLHARWSKKVKRDCTFPTFDAFLRWVSQSDYAPRRLLCKYDDRKPHSPENSFWFSGKERKQASRKKMEEYNSLESRFCKGCKQKYTTCDHGCYIWRKAWVDNWNKYICRKTEEKPERETFQYEHPDLVREGIVWRGN